MYLCFSQRLLFISEPMIRLKLSILVFLLGICFFKSQTNQDNLVQMNEMFVYNNPGKTEKISNYLLKQPLSEEFRLNISLVKARQFYFQNKYWEAFKQLKEIQKTQKINSVLYLKKELLFIDLLDSLGLKAPVKKEIEFIQIPKGNDIASVYVSFIKLNHSSSKNKIKELQQLQFKISKINDSGKDFLQNRILFQLADEQIKKKTIRFCV